MVTTDSKGNLQINCPSFTYVEYPYILRSLIATIQTAVTHPHFDGEIQNEVDFALQFVFEILPTEAQSKLFLSNGTP